MSMSDKCPACGKGIHGQDALCDLHYKEYLGQNHGSHSDVPDNENPTMFVLKPRPVMPEVIIPKRKNNHFPNRGMGKR